VIKVETQKDTITAQEQFAFEVGEALGHACEELESTCESVNRAFAKEVNLAASKHAMSREQVEKVLADFGGNEADISIGRGWSLAGSMNVIDVLRSAFETVLGEDKATRIYKCNENAEKEA
jgi:hypothetical protein